MRITPKIVDIMMDSIFIMEKSLTDVNLQQDKPEILIRPKMDEFRFFDFNKAEEGISIGKKTTEDMMSQILMILDQ